MTAKKATPKRKLSLIGLIFLSLFLSILILYGMSVYLWTFHDFETALAFLSQLLQANQVILSGLDDTILSHPEVSGCFQKINGFLYADSLSEKAQALTQTGVAGLREGLSGFLGKDWESGAIQTGAGFFKSAYEVVLKGGWLFLLVIKIVVIKAFLLIAALPLFLVLGAVGLIDGLSLREIRRASLGRESSYLFHLLNKWVIRMIGFGLCVWICMPVSVNPQWFFLPLALLFSMMLSLSASKFKKYL